MSRIAKNPIKISKEIECSFSAGVFTVKGKLGNMKISVNLNYDIKINGDEINVIPINGDKNDPNWGTTRAIVANTIDGVTNGFTKTLELNGSFKEGDNLFKMNCVGCHGITARGLVGPDLNLITQRLNDKEIISKIINHAGGQSLVITLNVTKIQNTYFHFYSDEIDKIYSLKEMLNYLNSFDIGELIIYDKDRDGTYKGYDLDLIEFVKSNSNLRFTILGGAVDRSDFTRAINICPYIGCAAGNMFVFKGSKNSVLINYTNFRK